MFLSKEAIAERYTTTLRMVSEIANAYYFQGRMDEALRLFQTGEHWLSASETPLQAQTQFLLQYAQFLIHRYFLTNEEEDLMHSMVQHTRQAAETSQDQAAIATALYLTGQMLYYRNLFTGESDYSEARDYLERASVLYERLGNYYHLADSVFYTGLTYDREQPDERTREHLQRALALAERHENKWAASEALRHLTDYTDGEQRLNHALRSLELRKEMNFKRGLPPAQLLVSDIYVTRGELEQALEYCQQADQLAREMNLPIYLINALITRGEILLIQGQRELAREQFEQADALARQFNFTRWLTVINEKLEALS